MTVGPLLAIDNLAVRYATQAGTVAAIDDVSLRLAPGETLGIVGESGSGKSTLGLAVMGLLPDAACVEGRIVVDGVDVTKAEAAEVNRIRGRTVGLVYQDSLSALNPVRPVGAQIAEVVRCHLGLRGAAARDAVIAALGRVGISDPEMRARQYPHEFSGGMRQRAAIAMALAARPKLVIADEPTTALDVTVQAQILGLLRDVRRDLGMAMIVISHDLDVIAEVAERMAVMYHGRLVEIGDTRNVLTAPRHPYTRALIRSAPSVERPVISFIPGTPPKAGVEMAGCSFEPRCDIGEGREVCRSRRPSLVGEGDDRAACHFPLVGPHASGGAPSARGDGALPFMHSNHRTV